MIHRGWRCPFEKRGVVVVYLGLGPVKVIEAEMKEEREMQSGRRRRNSRWRRRGLRGVCFGASFVCFW